NYNEHTSYDLAQTDEVQQLFKCSQSHFRFIFARTNSISTSSIERDAKCKKFPDEDEVLILPYSPFQITKISFRPNKIGKIFDNGNNVKSNMEEINERRLES
ncbi:unnamed protein product, partial [Rotaria sordida]